MFEQPTNLSKRSTILLKRSTILLKGSSILLNRSKILYKRTTQLKFLAMGLYCNLLFFSCIVDYVYSHPTYFAKRLYKAMKGLGTNDDTLVRVIVSQREVCCNKYNENSLAVKSVRTIRSS